MKFESSDWPIKSRDFISQFDWLIWSYREKILGPGPSQGLKSFYGHTEFLVQGRGGLKSFKMNLII